MRKIVCVCLAYTASLGFFTNTASAQNLTGLWVRADGAQAKIVHSGSSLRVSDWGGPSNPNLSGTSALSGGPTTFRGTFQNRLGEWSGAGTINYMVVNSNTIYYSGEGIVTHRSTKAPWRGSGYLYRQVQLPDLTGKWYSAYNKAWFTLRRDGNGYTCDNFQGWRLRVTPEGNNFRLTWSGRSAGLTYSTRITPNRIEWSGGNVYSR